MAEYRNPRNGPSLGRYSKALARIFLVLFLSLCWLIPAVPAHAQIPNPDSLSLNDIFVNRNLIETGDMLIYFKYNIAYSSYPTTVTASNAFVIRLFDTDGTTELGRITPYAFKNAGFGYGISAIYFSASTAPAWNGAYLLSLEGNPVHFTSPMTYPVFLTVANYSTLTTRDGNQSQAKSKMIAIIQALEVAWNNDLLTQTNSITVLGTAGEEYMLYAIPNIHQMVPGLFGSKVILPEYSNRNWTRGNLSSTYENRYNGTFIGNFTPNLASLFGVGVSFASGLVVFLGCLACIIFTAVKFQTALPGFLGAILVQLGGYLMGWFAPGFLGIVGFLAVLYIGYWWFFGRG